MPLVAPRSKRVEWQTGVVFGVAVGVAITRGVSVPITVASGWAGVAVESGVGEVGRKGTFLKHAWLERINRRNEENKTRCLKNELLKGNPRKGSMALPVFKTLGRRFITRERERVRV